MPEKMHNPRITRTKSLKAVVAPTTTATLVLAANVRRGVALLANGHATDTVYLGPSGVTALTGIPLAAGLTLTDDFSTDAWYAITAAGTGNVRIIEV